MKINVDKTKSVIKVEPGDIAYFDNDYWLIGWWKLLDEKHRYYAFISLSTAKRVEAVKRNKAIDYDALTSYLEAKKAEIYDGSKSKLDVVIKEPVTNHG